ncbi:hypothetical protein BQ8794_10111 [Mesorhizobium prunaredense]|uniref:Uncharacterized protein n=2 Tax=Mesorhizobium prunaredense TaxID=1631249 RepID=A0A1R3V2W9_9HYPH|nr:hypothetical protein BQ8794_10111 [Mesorhizobium prunaredense]
MFRENPGKVTIRIVTLSAVAIFLGFGAWLEANQPMMVRVACSVVAFALTAICFATIARLLTGKHRVLTLSTDGFQFSNIAPEFVPWSAVTSISVVPISFRGRQRSSLLEVKIKEPEWGKLTLTRAAKLNKLQTGAMWVPWVGEEASFESFLTTMKSYIRAHGGKVD